jgi:hypothetical protein
MTDKFNTMKNVIPPPLSLIEKHFHCLRENFKEVKRKFFVYNINRKNCAKKILRSIVFEQFKLLSKRFFGRVRQRMNF